MTKFKQAILILCMSVTLSTGVNAAGVLGKQLSNIENSILNESIITRQKDFINERASRLTNTVEQGISSSKLLKALPDGEVSSLIFPVGKLRQAVSIIDNAGNTLFRDVEVEHGWRAIEQQWLVMSSKDELVQLQQIAKSNKITLINTKSFDALGLTLVQFKVNKGIDSAANLAAILPSSLHKKLTRDYVYQTQLSDQDNSATQKNAISSGSTQPKNIKTQHTLTQVNKAVCSAPLSIGIVDTAIDIRHPAFKGKAIIRKSFVDSQLTPPKAHGTAVSALLVSSSSELPALLPKAKLFAAEVFYGQSDFTQGANLFSLVSGINWLLSQPISVINMSLAGPDNAVLSKVIDSALAKGVIIVVAVGNEGPHSPPLYPAAYKNVIGVTAIDSKSKLYRWANRGDHVDLSALGVSVKTARLSGDFGYESGTSMAAPVVSAYAACAKQKSLQKNKDYWAILIEKVTDLGKKGHDPLYGYGALGL